MNDPVKSPPQPPNLNSRKIEILLEDVLGCRWTFAVLRAVAEGVRRPGALKRAISGISAKVLNERLRRFTDAGLFERVQFPEIPPPCGIPSD
jgi:DNA-binding HxlR family transcriptional regulator